MNTGKFQICIWTIFVTPRLKLKENTILLDLKIECDSF